MKNKRQYRDSAMFTMIGYIGILLVVLAVLVGIGDYTGFNEKVQKGLQEDPRPLSPLINYSHPDELVKDTLTLQDSLEIIDPDMMYLRNPDEDEFDDIMGNYELKTYEDSEDDLEHWYTVVDTNSNGVPDKIEMWDPKKQKWVLRNMDTLCYHAEKGDTLYKLIWNQSKEEWMHIDTIINE